MAQAGVACGQKKPSKKRGKNKRKGMRNLALPLLTKILNNVLKTSYFIATSNVRPPMRTR